ncbi:hypothetical protein H8E88_05815 [candidate division KSB1 bacterium]|nr:hypothetical protein [candidate division KSB1 bacterium]MBL7094614.1 hypothetical protein [candidate division KSB1 bacterium]
MKNQYNFEIIFKKLDEAKTEQSQIDSSDFSTSKKINEQIEELKKFYEDLPTAEMETYTRS